MAETVVSSPYGDITVTHPDGASDADIIAYAKANATPQVSGAADVARSVMAAPRKVAEGLIGLPGTINEGVKAASNWLAGEDIEKKVSGGQGVPTYLPTPQDIQAQTSKVLGPSYQPQTEAGKYAGGITEGVTGAMLGPGSLLAKLLIGGASGAGSQAGQEYLPDHPIVGGLVGGLAGGLGAAGLGKAAEATANHMAAKSAGAAIGDVLGTPPVPAGAVRRVAQSAEQDNLTLPGAQQTQAQLGNDSATAHHDAMIMDLGRQLQGRAEQMAVQPGAAQNTVLNAVEGRTGEFGSGAAGRFRQTLDNNLGPSQNVVQLIDRVDDLVQKQAAPAYKQVMEKYPQIDVPADITTRPVVANAMRNAETLAKNYGDPLRPTQQVQTELAGPGYHIANEITQPPPTGLKYWDYVKKSLDQRINGMMRSGMDDLSSAEKSDLGGLVNAKQALVSHLDTVTGGEYANARRIAATKPELHDALDFGRSIFNSNLLPEEVSAHIGDLSLPGQAMAQVGARRELERVLSSVRNDGAKARNFLDTNNNAQKISALFGPDAAKAIENRVAAENTFQSATENIARNSRTALRTELAKDTADPTAVNLGQTAFGTIVGAPVKAGIGYFLQHGMANTRSGISDILTARGPQITPIVDQLIKYNAAKAARKTAPLGQDAALIARALMTEQAGR